MIKSIHNPKWNLKVYFKDDLHDYPEDHEQVNSFILEENQKIDA